MSAHTPGPWDVVAPEPEESVQELAVKHGRLFVATVHDMTRDETNANARLIAAAPELLAALKAAKDALESRIASGCPWCGAEGRWTNEHDPTVVPRPIQVVHKGFCEYADAVEAIAKAEGR